MGEAPAAPCAPTALASAATRPEPSGPGGQPGAWWAVQCGWSRRLSAGTARRGLQSGGPAASARLWWPGQRLAGGPWAGFCQGQWGGEGALCCRGPLAWGGSPCLRRAAPTGPPWCQAQLATPSPVGWPMRPGHPALGGGSRVGLHEPGPCCPRPRLRVALGQLPRALDEMEAGLGRGRRTKPDCVGWAPRAGPGLVLQPVRGQCPQPQRGGGSEKGPVLPSSVLLGSVTCRLGLGFLPVCWGDGFGGFWGSHRSMRVERWHTSWGHSPWPGGAGL